MESTSAVVQADEREQIEAQAQLLAFDRQNHSGASDALAANLKVRCWPRRPPRAVLVASDVSCCTEAPSLTCRQLSCCSRLHVRTTASVLCVVLVEHSWSYHSVASATYEIHQRRDRPVVHARLADRCTVCHRPKNAIREEAEELLSEKRVISGAINIRTNKDKMKVCRSCPLCFCSCGACDKPKYDT